MVGESCDLRLRGLSVIDDDERGFGAESCGVEYHMAIQAPELTRGKTHTVTQGIETGSQGET